MRPLNQVYFNAITGTTTGAKLWASSYYSISLTGVGTSTLAGTIKMQASNDFDNSADLDSFSPSNWVDVASATATVTAATAFIMPKTDVCYQWVRFIFTASGGTGALTANIKTIGL